MNDFATMEQRFDPKGGLVEFGDDRNLFVEFYSRSVPDEVASRVAGSSSSAIAEAKASWCLA